MLIKMEGTFFDKLLDILEKHKLDENYSRDDCTEHEMLEQIDYICEQYNEHVKIMRGIQRDILRCYSV